MHFVPRTSSAQSLFPVLLNEDMEKVSERNVYHPICWTASLRTAPQRTEPNKIKRRQISRFQRMTECGLAVAGRLGGFLCFAMVKSSC